MNIKQVLYAVTVEDVVNVCEETKVDFTENDIEFIQEKIGDFMGDTWHDAVEFALEELKTREF